MSDPEALTESPEGAAPPEGVKQPALAPRLTLRSLWRELMERFLNVENGLLHTVQTMFTNPGRVVRGYLDGHRRIYVNPFAYLLFGYLVALASFALMGYEELVLDEMHRRMAEQAAEQGRMIPRQLEESLVQGMSTMLQNSHYISIVICVPFALLLRLFFRSSGINLAEAFAFALYLMGQSALLGAIFSLHHFLPGATFNSTLHTWLSYGVLSATACWFGLGFFGRSWGAAVKTWLAATLSYVVFFAVFFTLLVGYVVYLITVVGVGSREPTLFMAVEQNQLSLARSLLDEGADPSQALGTTPLHRSAEEGLEEMAALLIEAGADLDSRDHLGRSPLEVALEERHGELAKALIESGADVCAQRANGRTVVMTAVARKQHEALAMLLERGGDPNVLRDDENATALMLAAAAGDRRSVELLLAHGADPGIANGEGKTAADLAESDSLAALLRAARAPSESGSETP